MLIHWCGRDARFPKGKSDQLVVDLTPRGFVGWSEQVYRAAIGVRAWWVIAYGSTPPYVKNSAALRPRSSKRVLADLQTVLPRCSHAGCDALNGKAKEVAKLLGLLGRGVGRQAAAAL